MTTGNKAALAAAASIERSARWRLWVALLLVLGLGFINLIVGLAGLLGSAPARHAGFGILNAAAGAMLLGFGAHALAWRRRGAPPALSFYLAAAVFALVSGAEVIAVARGGDENAATRIAGVLVRLLVFVPLITGGASAAAALVRKQER